MGRAGGGGLCVVCFVCFLLWSLGTQSHFLPELNIGSTNVLLLLRWPKAVLSPLRWCNTVGDAIAFLLGKAIRKVGQEVSLTKANMFRRSNT